MSSEAIGRIKLGSLAGLAGGVVFAVVLSIYGGLLEIGRLVGDPSPATSLFLHLSIAAAGGGLFGFVLVRRPRPWSGAVVGILYGGLCYALGQLTLLPTLDLVGREIVEAWGAAATVAAVPALVGHLLYGLTLGVLYPRLADPAARWARPTERPGPSRGRRLV